MKYREAINKINETKTILLDYLRQEKNNNHKIKLNEKKPIFRSFALFIKSIIL